VKPHTSPTYLPLHYTLSAERRAGARKATALTGSSHWVRPDTLDALLDPTQEQIHILSPFDPLIIQRKRLRLFFDYEYRFEAYVPKHKRIVGYFVCPVLIGDRIIAALDLKTDRSRQQLLVQRWNWIGRGASRTHQQQVEAALHKFEQFQLCRSEIAR
jgi:uncharacterized protein